MHLVIEWSKQVYVDEIARLHKVPQIFMLLGIVNLHCFYGSAHKLLLSDDYKGTVTPFENRLPKLVALNVTLPETVHILVVHKLKGRVLLGQRLKLILKGSAVHALEDTYHHVVRVLRPSLFQVLLRKNNFDFVSSIETPHVCH